MKHRHAARARTGAVIVALICGLVAVTHDPATASETGPAIDHNWPDPHIVHDPVTGRYYSYATNIRIYGTLYNVPAKSSPDLADWSAFEGDVLPTLPSWAQAGQDLTWAPGVGRIDGSWRLYYTARHKTSGRQCIGVAKAATPTGPFTPHGTSPLVCQTTLGGSIDAFPYEDPATGTWYLTWKSDENAIGQKSRIWTRELTSDGLGLTGPEHHLLTNDRSWETPLIENPAMVKAGARWILFYSANWWESENYATGYADCAGPAGPCTKKTLTGPWLSSENSEWVGPGGASTVTDETGSLHLVFHSWRSNVGYANGGHRATSIEPVTVPATGAPALPHSVTPNAAAAVHVYLTNRQGSSTGEITARFGITGDHHLGCDIDGDQKSELVVFRAGTWYFDDAADGGEAAKTVQFGAAGDTPACGDTNGDGVDDLIVVRDRVWYFNTTRNNGHVTTKFAYGLSSDTPVVGDWNGDGIDTIGVVRGRTWYLRNTNRPGNADYTVTYGRAGDVPVVGDWDGNGTDTVAVRRDNVFYLQNAIAGGNAAITFSYGRATDSPVVGDWNGDRVTTVGVSR